MGNNIKELKKITDSFSDLERETAINNRFGYIFSKAKLFLKIDANEYRMRDFYNQPPIEFDEDDLKILANGCNQILQGYGVFPDKPLTNLDVTGFSALFEMFHFNSISRKSNHSFIFNNEEGILDSITFEHIVEGGKVTYYNFIAI